MVRVRRRRNPAAITETHPLAMLPEITVQLEWDEDQECWVTTVPELLGISTFGKTQEQALESTREMVLGYVESMRSNGLRLPLPAAAVRRLISALS